MTTITPETTTIYHSKEFLAQRVTESLECAERYIDAGLVIIKTHAPIFSTSGRVGCTCEAHYRSDKCRDSGHSKYDPNYTCPNPGKHPYGAWKDITDVMSYKQAVSIWGRAHQALDVDTGQRVNIVWNMGILTGPSNVLTLDADTYKGTYQCDLSDLIPLDDQETSQQLTHSGGLHLMFDREGKPYTNANGELKAAGIDGVDIRGEGGFQVVEPSLGPSGNQYEWIEGYAPWEIELHPIPVELDKLLAAAMGKRTQPHAVNFAEVTTVKPDLAQWHLSHKVMDLLHNPKPKGERSDADQYVITALCYAGATDDAILAFFEHFPIGKDGKFADDGRGYLERSIGKARAYMENHPRSDNLGNVDDMADGFGDAPDINLNGATHIDDAQPGDPQAANSAGQAGPSTQGTKIPPIIALLKKIDDAGNDAKQKMVAGKMPPQVRLALESKIEVLQSEIASLGKYAVLIADAIHRAGDYDFDDTLLNVQEWVLSAKIGKERAKGMAAIKHKVDKLRNMGHKFRLNLMEDNVEMDGKLIDDVAKSELYLYMDAHKIKQRETDDCLNILAKEDTYHPIKDHLNSLVWDGQNHLTRMLNHLVGDGRYIDYKNKRIVTIGDTADHARGIITKEECTSGNYAPLHFVMIRRWMLGCVYRAMEGDKQTAFKYQTPVLVFVGGQGLGKSAWVRYLASGVGFDYHRESPLDPHHPEHIRSAVTKWIWEISELGSSLRRTDRDAVKGFITQEWHTYRKPWGRGQITKPTLCNFVGTINNETGFLDDPTGSRRYLPVNISHINHGYKDTVDINQVWAQIVELYRKGESPELCAAEKAALGETLEEHEVENPLQGHIQRLFTIDPSNTTAFTFTSDIIRTLKADGIALNANSKWAGREVNEALAPLGVKREKRSIIGIKGWGWLGVWPRQSLPGTVP